jgi:hypothetical protein
MQFGDNAQAFAGDGIIIGGALIATAFSIVALVNKGRARTPSAIETNFLAHLFGRPPAPNSELPDEVWRYLDTPLVGEKTSARQQLVDKWVREGRVSLAPTAAARARIDQLTRPVARHELAPGGLFDDRADMLGDLRSRVASMNIDLQLLVRQVRAHR